jgi:hypothetical protein
MTKLEMITLDRDQDLLLAPARIYFLPYNFVDVGVWELNRGLLNMSEQTRDEQVH